MPQAFAVRRREPSRQGEVTLCLRCSCLLFLAADGIVCFHRQLSVYRSGMTHVGLRPRSWSRSVTQAVSQLSVLSRVRNSDGQGNSWFLCFAGQSFDPDDDQVEDVPPPPPPPLALQNFMHQPPVSAGFPPLSQQQQQQQGVPAGAGFLPSVSHPGPADYNSYPSVGPGVGQPASPAASARAFSVAPSNGKASKKSFHKGFKKYKHN